MNVSSHYRLFLLNTWSCSGIVTLSGRGDGGEAVVVCALGYVKVCDSARAVTHDAAWRPTAPPAL